MILLELFWTFFKIGAFTFGGGYAMLPLIQSEVAAKQWLPEQLMVDFVAVSESTPGPFAINMATFVGTKMAGLPGAFAATLGVVLPSFVIILLVAKGFQRFRDSRIVRGCMSGLKPAVVGMIATAVLSVGKTVFFPTGIMLTVFTSPEFYISAGIFLLVLLMAMKKVHPILLICLSAVTGIAVGLLGLIA